MENTDEQTGQVEVCEVGRVVTKTEREDGVTKTQAVRKPRHAVASGHRRKGDESGE